MNKSVNVFLRSVARQAAVWGFCFFCYCNLALAGSVTFQRDYTYEAGEADSKLSCRAIALEQVKRLLLEELGTYLESETEIRNMQLAKDQITILTAGIVRVQVADEKWDGRTYYLRAKITADPKEVYNSIDKLRQDRQQIQELRVIREEADKALSIVEILKKALRVSDDEYKKAVAKLRATQWVEKGRDLVLSGKAQEAIEALAEAIVLNPNWAESYLWRGRAYAALDERYDAIRDYNKAIELDPKSAESHFVPCECL